MSDKEKFIRRTSRILDIPLDAAVGIPHIEISGDSQAIIENHKGILEYTENLLTVNLGAYILTIAGAKLNITAMNEQGLRINGRIEDLHFESV